MAEDKKVSFGFSKLKAPSKVIKPLATSSSSKCQTNTLQLIDCLENQSMKVKNEVIEAKKELVIPLKPSNVSQKIISVNIVPPSDSVEIKKEESTDTDQNSKISNGTSVTPVVKVKEEVVVKEDANSLDAQARREILESLSKGDVETETKIFSLPLTTNAPKEGEKESTLDDYENIPIEQFGMAMLRGMGWKPDESKNKNKPLDVILRPKGLGLGADKSAAATKSTANTEDSKLIKNCCVKITGGMFKKRYGKLESFNEDSGRVVVKLALRDEHVTVSESLLMRVTQGDYDKNSRVMNMRKYEEYKEQDAKQSKEERSSSDEARSERSGKSKAYSRRNECDSEDGQEKKKRNYEKRENNYYRKSREEERSRIDNKDRRRDSSRSCYKESDKRTYSRVESDNERHQRTNRKQEYDSRHSRRNCDSQKFTRDSSASSSDDEDYKKVSRSNRRDIENERTKRQDEKRIERRKEDRKERKKSKRRRRSSSESDSSQSSEDDGRKKTSKRRKSESSDEDRRKKSKKVRHEPSSSESESERRKKKKKRNKKNKHR